MKDEECRWGAQREAEAEGGEDRRPAVETCGAGELDTGTQWDSQQASLAQAPRVTPEPCLCCGSGL